MSSVSAVVRKITRPSAAGAVAFGDFMGGDLRPLGWCLRRFSLPANL
jgi:hypothetical protein